MTDAELTLLSNLPMNGGRLPIGGIAGRREDYANAEAQGWLVYRQGDVLPYLEITPEGMRAAGQEVNNRLFATAPTSPE